MQSDKFRAAAESKDFSAFEEISPRRSASAARRWFKPYEGRDGVGSWWRLVAEVLEDFSYSDLIRDGP
jgi:hypothetical protein